jgi:hypothetical protein
VDVVGDHLPRVWRAADVPVAPAVPMAPAEREPVAPNEAVAPEEAPAPVAEGPATQPVPVPAPPVAPPPVAAAPVPVVPPLFRARDDPSWLLARPSAADVRGHYVLGAAAASFVSAVILYQTVSVYEGWRTAGSTVGRWRALQVENAGGWLLGGLGVALAVRAATIHEPDPVAADAAEIGP